MPFPKKALKFYNKILLKNGMQGHRQRRFHRSPIMGLRKGRRNSRLTRYKVMKKPSSALLFRNVAFSDRPPKLGHFSKKKLFLWNNMAHLYWFVEKVLDEKTR